MAKLFNVKILTPEREYFDGEVEAVTVSAPDGSVTVLADHAPFIMPVVVGTIKMKIDGEWEESINTEGFMEVRHHGTLIYVQACENPEEIDIRRAEEAKTRASEHLRQKQSMSEYKQSQLALARAMARLKITQIDS